MADVESTEPIPAWATAEDQVTAAKTALVVRVLHADDGETSVRIWDTDAEVSGVQIFTGSIELPSGVIRVSDAHREQKTELNLGVGRHDITVFADANTEASVIDLIV
ncbi:hypothetical protein [Actinophytocola glycyrrhizae]|uniref:Uncharacterized protein n=1 Tax=Actinophytocola glycyrrhizae TaxID=2044873 RepID=A0ABV9RXG2_9PSEU